jgi:hypothetical protein
MAFDFNTWNPGGVPAAGTTTPSITEIAQAGTGVTQAPFPTQGHATPANVAYQSGATPSAPVDPAAAPNFGFLGSLGKLPQPQNTPPPAPPGLGAHGFQGAGGLLDYYDRFNQLRV